MSVAQEIQRIAQAKVDLRKAIMEKGVKIADTDRIDTYANKVAQIEGGGSGGSSEGSGKYRVRFFDYDGTILKTAYTDGGAVTAPNVPEHDRLLFQEWNNDFDDITADLDVGAIYTTKSGKSEFDLDMNNLTGLTQYVGIKLVSGTATIEWGDGQSETLSTIGETRASHTYAVGGKYTIMVSGTGEWELMTSALANPNDTSFTANHAVVAVYLAGCGYLNNGLQMIPCCETATVDAAPHYFYVGLFAFSGIKHFNFPRNLKTANYQLNAQVFNQCRSLRSVVFAHETPWTYPRWIYFSGTALTDVVLPDTVERIGDRDFYDAPLLKEIVIPSRVTIIEGGAFTNGYNPNFAGLKKVIMKPTTPPTIALNVGNVLQSSFSYNGSLKEIIVPAGCAEAYKNATNWSYYADIIKEEDI